MKVIGAAVETADYLWFSEKKFNGLFYIDKLTNMIHYVDVFAGEGLYDIDLHSHMVLHNNILIALPHNGKNIILYNIETHTQESFPIEQYLPQNTQGGLRISGYYIWNDELWVLPSSYDIPIYILDLKNKEVKEDIVFFDFLKEKDIKLYCYTSFQRVVGMDDTIFLLSGYDDRIIKYNLKEKKGEVYKLGAGRIMGTALNVINNQLWFVLRSKQGLGCLEIESGKYTIYDQYPEEFAVKNMGDVLAQPFLNMFFGVHNIILIPARANMVISFDLDKKAFFSYGKIKENGFYFNYYSKGDKLVVFPVSNSPVLEIDTQRECFSEIVDIKEKSTEYMNIKNAENGMFEEGKPFLLKNFLQNVREGS